MLTGGLLACAAPQLRAQADSARVSYRTVDVIFFTAGRAEGVRVGDTVAVVASGGGDLARAVVVSAALHTASARLLSSDAPVASGQPIENGVLVPATRPGEVARSV